MSLLVFFGDLKIGEKRTVTNDKGESYTARRKKDGTISVKGNNKKSRDKLNQY